MYKGQFNPPEILDIMGIYGNKSWISCVLKWSDGDRMEIYGHIIEWLNIGLS